MALYISKTRYGLLPNYTDSFKEIWYYSRFIISSSNKICERPRGAYRLNIILRIKIINQGIRNMKYEKSLCWKQVTNIRYIISRWCILIGWPSSYSFLHFVSRWVFSWIHFYFEYSFINFISCFFSRICCDTIYKQIDRATLDCTGSLQG